MSAAAAESVAFSELVRRRMGELGVSLRALCRRAEYDPSLLSKMLAGKRSPPFEESVLRRLAAALELEPLLLIVSAGRVPERWGKLLRNPEMLDEIERLAGGGAPRLAAARQAPAARAFRPAPAPAPRREERTETMSEELL